MNDMPDFLKTKAEATDDLGEAFKTKEDKTCGTTPPKTVTIILTTIIWTALACVIMALVMLYINKPCVCENTTTDCAVPADAPEKPADGNEPHAEDSESPADAPEKPADASEPPADGSESPEKPAENSESSTEKNN